MLVAGIGITNTTFFFVAMREMFFPTLIDHLQYYMNTKQEVALCLEMLGDVITALQKSEKVRR